MKKYILLIFVMVILISLFGFQNKEQAQSIENNVNIYEKYDFDPQKRQYELFIFDLLTPVIIDEVRKQYGVPKGSGISVSTITNDDGNIAQIKPPRKTNYEYGFRWKITFNIKTRVRTESDIIEGQDRITIGINPEQLFNDHPNIHNVKILKYKKSVQSD